MNTSNFDWLTQLPTIDTPDDGILQSLGLETNGLTTVTSTSNLHGDQDVVKYLFDSARFFTPTDLSTPSLPTQINSSQSVSSKSGCSSSADGDSPRSSPAATTSNKHNFTPLPVFDNNWITNADQVSHLTPMTTKPTPPIIHTTVKTNSDSRKMRIKKIREPIFVIELPQNAYKKKIKKSTPHNISPTDENDQQQQRQHHNSSLSSSFIQEGIDISRPSDKQHMTSKERRQHLNKISARNFRVRRKEYITELENIVDEQEDEIDSLKQEKKRLNNMNQQLVQEIMQLRIQQSTSAQSQPILSQQNSQGAYSFLVSPPNSDINSPSNIMDTLLDFDVFNSNNSSNNNRTYLSYSLMPALDLSAVLGDKLQSPPSSRELKEQQQVMTMYPLLAPALASIVLRHTFNLHYNAYLMNTFPYNVITRPKTEIFDIMHPEDWISAALTSNSPLVVIGDGEDAPNENRSTKLVSSHRMEQIDGSPKSSISSSSSSIDQNDTWAEDFERQVLRQHYPYYALMRLRGLSHDEIIQRYRAKMECRMATERQRRLKAATSYNKLQTLHAFTAVAFTLIRHPSRSPMIAGVIHDTKACQITPKSGNRKHKAAFMVASPFRTTLTISGGKA